MPWIKVRKSQKVPILWCPLKLQSQKIKAQLSYGLLSQTYVSPGMPWIKVRKSHKVPILCSFKFEKKNSFTFSNGNSGPISSPEVIVAVGPIPGESLR